MEIQKTEKYFCQEDGGHQLEYKVMTREYNKGKKFRKMGGSREYELYVKYFASTKCIVLLNNTGSHSEHCRFGLDNCCGSCPVHCRMFDSILGSCDFSSIPAVITIKNVFCGTKLPLVGNHRSKQIGANENSWEPGLVLVSELKYFHMT